MLSKETEETGQVKFATLFKTARDEGLFTASQEVFGSVTLSRIYEKLLEEPCTAGMLQEATKISEATIFRALVKLRELDLIEKAGILRREPKVVYHFMGRPTIRRGSGGTRPTIWRVKLGGA